MPALKPAILQISRFLSGGEAGESIALDDRQAVGTAERREQDDVTGLAHGGGANEEAGSAGGRGGASEGLRQAFLAGLKELAPILAGEFGKGDAELTADAGGSEIEHFADLGLDGDDETGRLGFEAVVTVVGLGLFQGGGVGRAAVECREAGRIPAPASLLGTGAGKNIFGGRELDGLKPEKVPTPWRQPLGVRRKGRAEVTVAGIGRWSREFHGIPQSRRMAVV